MKIYWIEGPWSGRLAILSRPRGGDWLEDEVQSWRTEGVNIVVSTLTSDEIGDFELAEEAEWCKRNSIDFVSFPIADRGVPLSAKAALELLGKLEAELVAGKAVGIHCRQGVGRSALLSASLLVLGGLPFETALERVKAARGCAVPETAEQREWVARFARNHLASLPPG